MLSFFVIAASHLDDHFYLIWAYLIVRAQVKQRSETAKHSLAPFSYAH